MFISIHGRRCLPYRVKATQKVSYLQQCMSLSVEYSAAPLESSGYRDDALVYPGMVFQWNDTPECETNISICMAFSHVLGFG